jgi:hypothetical protein
MYKTLGLQENIQGRDNQCGEGEIFLMACIHCSLEQQPPNSSEVCHFPRQKLPYS